MILQSSKNFESRHLCNGRYQHLANLDVFRGHTRCMEAAEGEISAKRTQVFWRICAVARISALLT